MDWYKKTISEALTELGLRSDDGLKGLSSVEAEERIGKYGPNQLVEEVGESLLARLLKQFTEFIILVLIGAAIVAGLLGEWVDTIAILAIVILNAVIGFLQEEKAERVLLALKKLSAPTAKVFRDGELKVLGAEYLVPGDIIIIDAGDNIPADCRVVESKLLKVDESALTGESNPIEKMVEPISATAPLGDRFNMLYSSTTVVYGRGKAVVVATAMDTEMGRIARMLQSVEREPTPLQKRLKEFGRLLVYAAGAACAAIFVLGLLRGEPLLEMFLTSVSLAVAAIPEGLPAVVTIVLALGVQKMVRRNALVRKLPSVETLGSATVIASDKTGTITQNQMTVTRLYLPALGFVGVTGSGYAPEGEFELSSGEVLDKIGKVGADSGAEVVAIKNALMVALLCNGAELKEDNGRWDVIGDPTEGALLSLANKGGLIKEKLLDELSFVGELPFDSKRKMMTTVYEDKDGIYHVFTKGAPERVVPLCEGSAHADIEAANDELAGSALRVLALAYKTVKELPDLHKTGDVERGLTFAGLAGMIDPPRAEVKEAIATCVRAGILPLMITGDHKLTAIAVAKETGAFAEGDLAVTGEELDNMSEAEFKRLLPEIKVYARVNPEHKLKIMRAWRARGDVIAMTGDGVNDAPALKEADIGVAMGITGTDVTKEASDMVLTDDNFASIVAAVEEGRGIFDNIRRVVHFLLSCNIGEILVLLVAVLTGMPLPLLPVQILWTNLVTDGLPAVGLAMEPTGPDVMEKSPRSAREGIITKRLFLLMLAQGAFMAVCTLAVYALEYYWLGAGLDKARTMAFVVLVFCQKFHVFNCRSEFKSAFKHGIFSNRMLNIAVVFILVSQILLVYVPGLQEIFKVVPLGALDWVLVFAAAIQPLFWMEIIKAIRGNNRG